MKKTTIIILIVSVILVAAIAVYFVLKNRPSVDSESENDENGDTDSTENDGGNHSGSGTVENGAGKTTTATLTYLDPSTLRPATPSVKEEEPVKLTSAEYILDQLENINSFDARYIEEKLKILAKSGVLLNGSDVSPLITQTLSMKPTLGIEQPDAYLKTLQELYKKVLQAYYQQVTRYASTQPQVVKGNNFGNR